MSGGETVPAKRRTPSGAGRRGEPPKARAAPFQPAAAADRPGLAARRVAAKLLSAVVDARTSADGLTDRRGGHPEFRALEPRDGALVKAILLSALRRRGTIEAALAASLDRPLPGKAASLRTILHVGAAQILFLDVPDSAAADLAVAAAAGDPRSARFAGLVNAVLRRIAREKSALLARFADPRIDVPGWLFARWASRYGEPAALAIAAVQRTPPPLDLTVKGGDAAGWAARLGGLVLPNGTVRLARHDGPVTDLAGFADGEWWVQDAAASLPVHLFGDVAGRRILDACAAPGGKTAQLASLGAHVTALDISASRMKRLTENLARLKLVAETAVADLAQFQPDALFDGVLLDAPCSSTGTIRRHPDVAYTKDAAEIDKLAAVQARLLREAARLVKPGGLLVFSNCSLDPAEGEAVAEAFVSGEAGFDPVPVRPEELPGLEEAVSPAGWLRTTPAMLRGGEPALSGLDGFFAARLRRR